MTPESPVLASDATPDHAALDVVVVLFHSDRKLFVRCIDSVERAAERAGITARFVFVDNGGGVPDPEAIRLPFVVVGAGENIGFGRAVNRAMATVTASTVLLLNPDAELAVTGLSAFAAAAARHPRGLHVGTLLTDGRIDPDSVIDWDFSVERLVRRATMRRSALTAPSPCAGSTTIDGAVVQVAKASGGALHADAALLRALGPFDEQYFLYCEDADLSRRARSAGVPIARVPAAIVHHVGSASARSHAALVEHARADAAIRLTAGHRSAVVGLAQRAELLAVTVLGVVLERDPSRRAARLGRLRALRRWGLRRTTSGLVAADVAR